MSEHQTEDTTAPTQAPPAEPPQKKKGGPRTVEGKRRSSLNATRHQLLSKTYIATPEESNAFNAHMAAVSRSPGPCRPPRKPIGHPHRDGSVEKFCGRLSIENSIFAQGYLDHAEAIDVDNSQVAEALAEAKTWTAEAHSLSLLNTYEGRISRRVDKNMAQLIAMQTQRKENMALPSVKRSTWCNSRKHKTPSTIPATISNPPARTASSFIQPPKSPASVTAKTASTAPGQPSTAPASFKKAA